MGRNFRTPGEHTCSAYALLLEVSPRTEVSSENWIGGAGFRGQLRSSGDSETRDSKKIRQPKLR